MTEPIHDTEYWRKRLVTAPEENLHHAIFRCPKSHWERIEAKHREILAYYIKDTDLILDCGCGWGRLYDLLPRVYGLHRRYLGIDLSPDFIALARKLHPGIPFQEGDLLNLSSVFLPTDPDLGEWDWAVMISIRPMVKRNMGEKVWAQMEEQIRKVAKKLLYLEYDPDDEGSVE